MNHVNLMTHGAQFRAAARRQVRFWGVAWIVLLALLVPAGLVRWNQLREAGEAQAALEARFEPIQQLTQQNRRLRTEAAKFVVAERISLELARDRSVTPLLTLIAKAASLTTGEVYLRRINIHQPTPGNSTTLPSRIRIEASGTLTYDITRFARELQQPPLREVKVLTTEIVEVEGVEQKNYTIECLF